MAGVTPGLSEPVGRGMGLGVALAVDRCGDRGVARWLGRGWDVRSGAGVPGTMSATPAPERPESRIGW